MSGRMLFGDKNTFAIGLLPLAGAPEEADPSAAATWTAMEIWAAGQNLTIHTHIDSDSVHHAVHWPLIYPVRWLVRSWPELFSRQRAPIPGHFRNARDTCSSLDKRYLDPDSELDPEPRDRYVATHSLLAGSGGGLVPDLYLWRDGDRASISWASGKGTGRTAFHHDSGEVDIPAAVFVDVIRGLVDATEGMLQSRQGETQAFRRDLQEIRDWLLHLDSPQAASDALAGYLGIAPEPEGVGSDVDRLAAEVLELPSDWKEAGGLFDAGRYPAAVMFRSLAPELSESDAVDVLRELRSLPADPEARSGIEQLKQKMPFVGGGAATDWDQGYSLAIALRGILGNENRYLDIEQLLDELGIEIREIELKDQSIDGGAIFDDRRGPFVLINPASPRSSVPWGRRMVLAHELCHLLVDTRRAAPLGVLSGPWAPPVLERRANAFAAELLLPMKGMLDTVGFLFQSPDDALIAKLRNEFAVGYTTCSEHIHNRFRLPRGS